MPASRIATLILTASVLALGAIGCGTSAATPEETPTDTPEAVVIATATPNARTTPTAPVRIRTAVQTACRLTYYGAEITLAYQATAETEGRMTRVRLLMNGRTVQDSGGILQTEFRSEKVFTVGAGGRHIFQVLVDTTGPQPTLTWSFTRCPEAPDPKALAPGLTRPVAALS